MDNLTTKLESIADQIRSGLSAKDVAREKVLPRCREVIRHCSNAIRAVHRREFDQAAELLEPAHSLLDEMRRAVADHGGLGNAGFIRNAEKEFAEGNITLALITGKPLPDPAELGVEPAAYLNGMGEAVGELRRYLLDSLRGGDLSRGEDLLSAMDDI